MKRYYHEPHQPLELYIRCLYIIPKKYWFYLYSFLGKEIISNKRFVLVRAVRGKILIF